MTEAATAVYFHVGAVMMATDVGSLTDAGFDLGGCVTLLDSVTDSSVTVP